jgi:hypothetical protein
MGVCLAVLPVLAIVLVKTLATTKITIATACQARHRRNGAPIKIRNLAWFWLKESGDAGILL